MNFREGEGQLNSSADIEKEKAAQDIREELKGSLDETEASLRENPVFEAKGRKFEINTPGDFLVAEAQQLKELSQEILEKYQGKDYQREKIAAKLEYFFQSMERFFQAYAELKEDYPEISDLVEEKYPLLAQAYKSSKQKLDGQNDQSTS